MDAGAKSASDFIADSVRSGLMSNSLVVFLIFSRFFELPSCFLPKFELLKEGSPRGVHARSLL